MPAFAILSGSGLWLPSPPLRCLFSLKPTSGHIPGFAHIIRAEGRLLWGKVCLSDSGSTAEPEHFVCLIVREMHETCYQHQVVFPWCLPGSFDWSRQGTGEEVEEMTSILSHGHRDRMERGELGCWNWRGWKAEMGGGVGSGILIASVFTRCSLLMYNAAWPHQKPVFIPSPLCFWAQGPSSPCQQLCPRSSEEAEAGGGWVVPGPTSPSPQSACWQRGI